MEIEERLNALLSRCVWVKDASTALRIVPSLAVDLPPLIALVDGGMCLPVACADELLTGVAEVLAQVGTAGLSSREPIHLADHEALMADPLVPRLAGLMAETVRPGLSGQAVPSLVTAWACAKLLGPTPWRGAREREIQALRSALAGLAPAEHGVALANLSWSISGRIGAAGALARQAGWEVRVAGLSRALLTTPLILSCPAGSLRTSEDLALAAAMLGVDLNEGIIDALQRATSAAISAAMSRITSGKSRPVDLELTSLLDGAQPDSVLFVPGLGARLPLMLTELIDVAGLTAAGVSKESAKALLKPMTARALSSAWGELQVGLLRWDLLSALCESVSPVTQSGGQWQVEAGMLPAGPWELLSPRYVRRPEERTVVAVNLSRLRAAAREVAVAQKLPVLSGLVERQWRTVAAATATHTLHGDFGIAIFAEPLKALEFALQAHQTLSNLGELDISPLGSPIRLLGGASISVGVTHGRLLGGFDGARTWLEGATITRATALCGSAPADGAAEDPLGIRGSYLGPDGFHSSSVVLGRRAAGAVAAALSSHKAVHVRGEGGTAAGVSEDFATYPIQLWWESSEGARALLSLSTADGAAEVLTMTAAELVDLHASDAMLARSRAQTEHVTAPEGAPLSSDPFADSFEEETDSFQAHQESFSDPGLPADPFSADPFADPAEPEEEESSGFGLLNAPAEPGRPVLDSFLDTGSDSFLNNDESPTIMARAPAAPEPAEIMEEDDESDFVFSDPDDTGAFDVIDDLDSDEDLSEDFPAEPPRSVPAPPMMLDDEDDEDEAAPLFAAPPMMLDDEDDEDEPPAADFIGEGSVSYESESEEFFALTEDDEDEIIATGGFGYDDDDDDDEEYEYEPDGPDSSLTYGNQAPIKPAGPAPPMMLEDDDRAQDSSFVVPDDLSFDDDMSFTVEDTGEENVSDHPTDRGPDLGFSFEEDDPSEEYSFEMETPQTVPPMMLDDDSGFGDADIGFLIPPEDLATVSDDVPDYSFSTMMDEVRDEDSTEDPGGFAFLDDSTLGTEPAIEAPLSAVPDAKDDAVDPEALSAAFMATDIPKIFHRYVVARTDSGFIFGRVDGYVLVDAHRYGGDELPQAYLQFLSDKMREGFMMQIHMTEDLVGLETKPVELRYLEKAYLAMMGA